MQKGLALTLCSLLPLTALAQQSECPPLPITPALSCTATAQGWFYAHDAATAADLAEDARLATATFEHHFGRPAARGAVVAAGTTAPVGSAALEPLRAAGASWQLPWLDAGDRRKLMRTSVERQLRTQRPDDSDAQIAALLDAALGATEPAQATDASALRHEIGHLLLIEAFWPGHRSGGNAPPAHYGGPGPDWLDETAAVLMESDAMATDRRNMLLEDDAAQHLDPLDVFFSRSHPLATSATLSKLRAQAMASGEARIQAVSGDEAAQLADGAGWFYAQARGVADFLVDTSGDPAIFGDIAAFIANGGDMDGWLAASGSRHSLPASIGALDAAWRDWLAQRATARHGKGSARTDRRPAIIDPAQPAGRTPPMTVKKPIARLQIRVVFDSGLVLGPGKVDLLEHVRDTGSISAAGRRMKMSYKRAWDLIDAMNKHFTSPVVETSKGGAGGGGARLTALGEEVIERYRRVQAEAADATDAQVRKLHHKLG